MKSMAKTATKPAEDLLWKIAESDEVEIETRRDAKSPLHRVTTWIVPTAYGVYVRSYKGKKGRWYQEALANPRVTVQLGRRKVTARAEPERNPLVIRAVNAAYRKKYGERWPDETQQMLRRSLLPTTLRLTPV
ncbi:MAG: hypothetical protein QOJ33_2354 [Chloroflexota bacterium]|jgi:hypothetical protein|nr:hypothetical protein [Chloroflexota bacterium]MEA2669420.1 hypothetical protein [Chloroflexota bacterium]